MLFTEYGSVEIGPNGVELKNKVIILTPAKDIEEFLLVDFDENFENFPLQIY